MFLLSRLQKLHVFRELSFEINRIDKKRGCLLYLQTIGFDYVNPLNDTVRTNIEENLKPFPRMNIEIGFRTVLAEVSGQTLFLNSTFKYFKEIGASSGIKKSKYSNFSYFAALLTTSGGLYVSYSFGKLPFDRVNDAIYEIGFKYKLE